MNEVVRALPYGVSSGKSAVSRQPDGNLLAETIHVLLVDDERLSRLVVGNLLKKCNYKVTAVSTGMQALEALRTNGAGTFQLVLTDVMMPDVDGIELLRHVRQDDSLGSVPVVMMSANEHPDTVFECIRAGAEDYLLKPLTKKEVQYIWQHVWRRKHQPALRVSPQPVQEQAARTETPFASQQPSSSSTRAQQPAQPALKAHHDNSDQQQTDAAVATGEAQSAHAPDMAASLESQSDHLADFSADLIDFSRYSQLKVKAELNYSDLLTVTDMVCSTAFDRDDEFFATAGVFRRVKIFDFASVQDSDTSIHYPVLEIPSRSKLSSVCWNSYVKSNLICSDYEGVVQLWDVSQQAETMTFEEHAKRVWSVDFSQTDPTRFLSGSDDGTVRLWSIADESAVACIDSKANVCSVQFSPTNSNLMAFGSANYRVYLYDLRQISAPLAVIGGHTKAVSYVRWVGGNQVISASTDNSLKLWDVADAAQSEGNCAPITSFTGHTNEKNFVGLSVSKGGYVACGSENNAVYCYNKAVPTPICDHKFGTPGQSHDPIEAHQFVSSVCWSRKSNTMISANSMGNIKVLELV
ncbi:hypothetical protein WJX82_011494 [Trebouxia sp. C0006]